MKFKSVISYLVSSISFFLVSALCYSQSVPQLDPKAGSYVDFEADIGGYADTIISVTTGEAKVDFSLGFEQGSSKPDSSFSVIGDEHFSIPAHSTYQIHVRYAPQLKYLSGDHFTRLVLRCVFPNYYEISINLRGYLKSPQPLMVSKESITFSLGDNQSSQNVSLRNLNKAHKTVLGVALKYSNPAFYVGNFGASFPTDLGGASALGFTVGVQPFTKCKETDTILYVYEDENHVQHGGKIPVSAVQYLQDSTHSKMFSMSSDIELFGPTRYGDTVTGTLTLTNVSDTSIPVSTINFANDPEMTVTNPPADKTMVPGEEMKLAVVYTPNASAHKGSNYDLYRSISLMIYSNDGIDGCPFMVSMPVSTFGFGSIFDTARTVVLPIISSDQTNTVMSTGADLVGYKSMIFYNNTKRALAISNLTIDDNNHFAATVVYPDHFYYTIPWYLLPGEYIVVGVNFNGTIPDTVYNATVSFDAYQMLQSVRFPVQASTYQTLSVKDRPNDGTRLTIYPNPAGGYTDISLASGSERSLSEQSTHFELFDPKGERLSAYDGTSWHFDIAKLDLPPGIYFIRTAGKIVASAMLVVTR